MEYPFLHVTVNGRGQATHMGRTTAFTDDQLVSLIDGSMATCDLTLTGAKGDTLILAMTFQRATNVEGGVTFTGNTYKNGGSGRFEGASGERLYCQVGHS